MKFLIQRCKNASVKVNNEIVGEIGKGFLVLVGISKTDDLKIADKMTNKLLNMRIFSDENEKFNLSLMDVNGELLIVSQFTLNANCRHGNRPEFLSSANYIDAKPIFDHIVSKCKESGLKVETGKFREHMEVSLINDGPVTIMLDSENI